MSTLTLLRRRLTKGRIWKRILMERLTEPIHLNLISVFIALFGKYSTKINWDLVVRHPYAYGILRAAQLAKESGFRSVTVAEFGVASGAGLMNMASIARQVSKETGVSFQIHGFDSGTGMPPARDYRDHPELYQEGDFPMDVAGLKAVLPPNVKLHLGDLAGTVKPFLDSLDGTAPIGFVSIDVDYYSSAVEVLEVFKGPPSAYLPLATVYADDVTLPTHNAKAGELLALAEFNSSMPYRQIEPHACFETWRIFRRADWLKQIRFLHVLDHPGRAVGAPSPTKRYLENPYLESETQSERFQIDPEASC